MALHAFFCFFLPNKLAPFSGVSLFRFSTSICPHQGTMKIQQYFPVENFMSTYLALSPENCETN